MRAGNSENGHRTRPVFDRHDIVTGQDSQEAVNRRHEYTKELRRKAEQKEDEAAKERSASATSRVGRSPIQAWDDSQRLLESCAAPILQESFQMSPAVDDFRRPVVHVGLTRPD